MCSIDIFAERLYSCSLGNWHCYWDNIGETFIENKDFTVKGNYFMKVLFISAGDYKYGAPKSMFELIVSLKNAYGVEA